MIDPAASSWTLLSCLTTTESNRQLHAPHRNIALRIYRSSAVTESGRCLLRRSVMISLEPAALPDLICLSTCSSSVVVSGGSSD